MTDFEKLIGLFDKDECPVTFLDRRDERAFAEYLLANGVIVPPLDVGQKVYTFYNVSLWDKRRRNAMIISFKVFERINPENIEIREKTYKKSYAAHLGKTVFLTREEAEKALAERQGKNEKP